MDIKVSDTIHNTSSTLATGLVNFNGRSDPWNARWAARISAQIRLGPRSASYSAVPARLSVRAVQALSARIARRRTTQHARYVAAKIPSGRITSIGFFMINCRSSANPLLIATDSHSKSLARRKLATRHYVCADTCSHRLARPGSRPAGTGTLGQRPVPERPAGGARRPHGRGLPA